MPNPLPSDGQKPTPAQLRALVAIERGEVMRNINFGTRTGYWVAPTAIRGDLITRVVDARWARVGSMRTPVLAPVELTDKGRDVLHG